MQLYRQLRLYPFIRILIPFVSGIILGLYFHPDINVACIAIIVFLSAACIIHKVAPNFTLRWLYGIVINLFLCSAGLLVLNLHHSDIHEHRKLYGEKVICEAIISEELAETEKTFRTVLMIRQIHHDSIEKKNFRVLTYFKKDSCASKLRMGDILLFHSELCEIDEPKNPYEFNYRKWLEHRGIVLGTFLFDNTWYKIGRKRSWKTFISDLRHQLIRIYKNSGISGNELAVLSALTLGQRQDLPDEIEDSFASAGAMHVLAVSGLHVGIIFLIINAILFFMKRFRYGSVIQCIIIILFLWFFAILTGLRPSVVRAVFMFSVIQAGQSLKRPPGIYNTISFSAFCLLLINPYQLFDAGFQLSYMAIAGIVFFQPKIYKILYFKNLIADKVWQLFTVSLAAQLATAPVTIYYFHYFPLYFWLTNMVVILLTGLIIYFAIFQIFIFALHLPYSFTGNILDFLLSLLNNMTCQIHELPHAQIRNISTSLFEIVLFYGMIISMTVYILIRNRKSLIWFFAILLVMMVFGTARTYIFTKQNKIVVFDAEPHSLVGLVKGREILFLSDVPDASDIHESFRLKNYLVKSGIRRIIQFPDLPEAQIADQSAFYVRQAGSNIFFRAGQIKGLLLNDFPVQGQHDIKRLYLDCVILSHNAKVGLEQLAGLFVFKQLILDSSNRYSYRLSWLKIKLPDHYDLHSVVENKAFEIKPESKF